MDTTFLSRMNPVLRSFLGTTLVCILTAMFSRSIWDDPYLIHLMISTGFGYGSIISFHIISAIKPNLSSKTTTLLAMASAIVVGTANAHFWLQHDEGYVFTDTLSSVLVLGVTFTGCCFAYFYNHEQKLIAEAERQNSRRKESEQHKALLLSQLNQLQSQIEPHFLFNTLANIGALIESDSAKASKMLTKFTELLRANLKSNREQLTTVAREAEVITAYLDIQQIRLGDRLSYEVNADNAVERLCVPPLLIQPLVENAITHGIEPARKGGSVIVNVTQEQQQLVITVSDSGVGLTADNASKGHGLGLTNIRERLDALFDGKARLDIQQASANGADQSNSQGVTAVMSLPIDGIERLRHTQAQPLTVHHEMRPAG